MSEQDIELLRNAAYMLRQRGDGAKGVACGYPWVHCAATDYCYMLASAVDRAADKLTPVPPKPTKTPAQKK